MVNVLGDEGDVLLGLSTSGNSKNICYTFETAKAKNMQTIAMTGKSGGKLKDFSDILLNVDSETTHIIQEKHIQLYHLLCRCIENELFDE